MKLLAFCRHRLGSTSIRWLVALGTIVSLSMTVVFLTAWAQERIALEGPEPVPPDGWQLTWESTPGERYLLERSLDGQSWTFVATIDAVASSTSYTDVLNPPPDRVFWQVTELDSDGDVTAPAVGALEARISSVEGEAALVLTVAASDPNGVLAVTFSRDGIPLDGGTEVNPGVWEFRKVLEPGEAVDAGAFQAQAIDPAGNTGFSTIRRLGLLDAQKFTPLALDGALLSRIPVEVDSSGFLSSFVYRLGGGRTAAWSEEFEVRFPEGAWLVFDAGEWKLEFLTASANFGPDSPFRLPSDLVRQGPPVNFTRAQLPLEGVDLADLAAAFGFSASAGTDVLVYDFLPLRWKGGTFTPLGLKNARYEVPLDELPLPTESADFPAFTINYGNVDEIALPFFGSFPLGESGATARIPVKKPLWLVIGSDGSLEITGRAELDFGVNGPSFAADFALTDPWYELQVTAKNIEVSLLDDLADLLPTDPASCLPASNDPVLLDLATACLNDYARTYVNFSAGAVGSEPIDELPGSNPFATPSLPYNTAVAALAAWGHRASLGISQTFPVQALRAALEGAERAMLTSNTLEYPLEVSAEILRICDAIQKGKIVVTPEIEAQVDGLIDTVEVVVRARVRDPQSLSTYAKAVQASGLLVKLAELYAVCGRPFASIAQEARDHLLYFLSKHYLVELDVVPGDLSLDNNTVIREEITYSRAFAELRQALQAQGNLLAIGWDGTSGPNADVTVGPPLPPPPFTTVQLQLLLRLWQDASANLLEARENEDALLFMEAFRILLDSLAQLEIVGVNTEDNDTAERVTLAEATQILGDLPFDFAIAAVKSENIAPTLAQSLEIIERFQPVLEAFPLGEATEDLTLQIQDQVIRAIEVALVDVETIDDPDVLWLILKAGVLLERMQRWAGLATTSDFESANLGETVMFLTALLEGRNDWTGLYRLVEFLLNEADRTHLLEQSDNPGLIAIDLQAVRRLYLEQATLPIVTMGRVADTLWAESEVSRADPGFALIDMLLPGDLRVEEVSGGFRFNRETGYLQGNFSGDLALPRFDARLKILTASLSNNGAFDLNAYGTISFPPDDAFGTLTVPADRPLQVSWSPRDGLRTSGGLRLSLANGMRFGGFWRVEDPYYALGVFAEGLRLDLLDEITVLQPSFPNAGLFAPEVSDALNEYFTGLNATYASFNESLEPVEIGEPGESPAFVAPVLSLETDTLETWINSAQSTLALNVNGAYGASVGALKQALNQLADSLRDRENELTQLLNDLDQEASDIEQLERYNRALKDLAELLAEEADREILGLDTDGLINSEEMGKALATAREATRNLLASDVAVGNLKKASGAAGTALELAATEELFGTSDQPDSLAVGEIVDFYERVQDTYLMDRGFDPETGALVDPTFLEGVEDGELETIAAQLLELVSTLEVMGAPDALADYRTSIEAVAREKRSRALETLRATPVEDWQKRQEALSRLMSNAEWEQLGAFGYTGPVEQLDGSMSSYDFSTEIDGLVEQFEEVAEQRAADERVRAANRARAEVDPFFALYLRFAKIDLSRITAELQAAIAIDIENLRERLHFWIVQNEWPRDRIRDGLSLLQEVRALAEAAASLDDTATLLEVQDVFLPMLTLEFTAVAEAQKAWWLLGEYGRLLNEAAREAADANLTALETAYQTGAADTVRAADRLAQSFAALRPAWEPVDLALPGELAVRRVYGQVHYNRITGVVGGAFGGRIEFPDIDAYFEIVEASLASDGSFAFVASTGGPLPFDGVSLDLLADLTGDGMGGFQFQGSGQMLIEGEGAPESYLAEVSYDTLTDELSVLAIGTNLDFRLTDDFVLFDAGIGFTFNTASPAGSLSVGGSAGIFAKEPLGATVEQDDFELFVEDVLTTFAYTETTVSVALESGTLHLPDVFQAGLCEEDSGARDGPTVGLTPGEAIQVLYNFDVNTLAFSGSIDFANIGYVLPDMPDLGVEICTATLSFADDELPRLTGVNAAMSLPLPEGPAFIDLVDATLRLDGFPEGTIALREDLALFEDGGFAFTLLGTDDTLCPAGNSLTITPLPDNHVELVLNGAVRLELPADSLTDREGDSLFGQTCGSLTVATNAAPSLSVDSLAIGGTFRIGGTGGLVVEDGLIGVSGLGNLFSQSPETPFEIVLSGMLKMEEGPGLGLQNARFSFIGETLPLFRIGGLSVASDPDFELFEGFPVQVTAASFTFTDDSLPLPDILNPNNITVTMSASVSITDEGTGTTFIEGTVDDLTLGTNDGVPFVRLNGFGFGIGGLEIPPMTLGGNVYVGGLQDPENLFFAGRLGGELNGTGIEALVAMNLRGPIGICLEVSAGPAGIPLGPTGFLLTGAQGGVSFLNTINDPCDFTSYISVGADGRPTGDSTGAPASPENVFLATTSGGSVPPALQEKMTWAQWQEQVERWKRYQEAAESAAAIESVQVAPTLALAHTMEEGEGEEIPCPTGDCPSPSVNIFCEPHPDETLYPDRVIIKFTSLDEPTLNGFGITESFINGLGLTDPADLAMRVALEIRSAVELVTPPVPDLPDDDLEAFLMAERLRFLDSLEQGFTTLFETALNELTGGQSFYEAIRAVAYQGVQCPDATVKLSGRFSHATVSTFLSADAGVVLSTTGSAGVVGAVNLLGVPVGTLDVFLSATDENGDPNPSLCGDLRVALGPLELGSLRALLACDGCLTGIFEAFVNSTTELVNAIGDQLVLEIVGIIAPDVAAMSPTPIDALLALTQEQQMAFLAELFQRPAIPGLADAFESLLTDSIDSLRPEFLFCGEVQPKLFGFALGDSLVNAQFYANRAELQAAFGFSPSYILGNLLLCVGSAGLGCGYFPDVDQATFGVALAGPDPSDILKAGFEGTFSTPGGFAAFAEDGFDRFLSDAAFTIDYQFNPFGLETGEAQMRVVMPNLTDHPVAPHVNWVAPINRGLPSRLDLLLALVRSDDSLLGSPLWKGDADDLFLAFPEGSSERDAVTGLNFQDDYFPHGGILGAARLQLPKLLVNAPPEELFDFLQPLPPLNDLPALAERIQLGFTIVENYLLMGEEVGNLAFYVPAPNPPSLTDGEGNTLTPQQVMAQIQSFVIANIGVGDLYPKVGFLAGELTGQLLGVPIFDGFVEAVPGDFDAGIDGYFLIEGTIPQGSWLRGFLGSAMLSFEVHQSPSETLDATFQRSQGVLADLVSQIDAGSTPPSDILVGAYQDFEDAIIDGLPKVSLDLALNGLMIPAPLQPILEAEGDFRLVAYSPRFDPGFVGEGPLAKATRQGGIAIQSRFTFGDLLTVENAELAITPRQDTALLPALAGRFEDGMVPLPGGLVFDYDFLAFNSEPGPNEAFLAGRGSIPPFVIGSLLQVEPLNEADPDLSGELSLIRNPDDSISTTVWIDPARAVFPFLGDSLEVLLYGATQCDASGQPTPGDQSLPFGYSSEGPWGATVQLTGAIEIADPSDPFTTVLTIAGNQDLIARICGVGTTEATVTAQLPTGIELTAYPGTPQERILTIGSTGDDPVTLIVSSDGTFSISGALESNFTMPGGLPVSAIELGAEFRFSNEGLYLAGDFSGGTLDDSTSAATAFGSIEIGFDGTVSFSAGTDLPPLQFGVFRVFGLGPDGRLTASLDNGGLYIPTGAQLAVTGLSDSVLTLQPVSILSNGDFVIDVASGSLVIAGYLGFTEGSMLLERTSGVTRFELVAPQTTIFPGESYAKALPPPGRLLIESSGRFYYDSCEQSLDLPFGVSAHGRVEFGYEPAVGSVPVIFVGTTEIDFGGLPLNQPDTRTFQITNTGTATMNADLSVDNPAYRASPAALTIAPGASATVQVVFLPTFDTTYQGTLTITHDDPANPDRLVSLTGSGLLSDDTVKSHTRLDFGRVPVGKSKVLSYVLGNRGTLSNFYNFLFLSNPDFRVVTPPASLTPGAKRRIDIEYAPSSAGLDSSSLLLFFSAGSQSVQLQGEGYYEEQYILPADFGHINELWQDIIGNLWGVTDRGWLVQGDPTDGGLRVDPLNPFGPLTGLTLSDYDSYGWAVGPEGAVWRSLDAGTSWNRAGGQAYSRYTQNWRDVALALPRTAFLAGEENGQGVLVEMNYINQINLPVIGSVPPLNAVDFRYEVNGQILSQGIVGLAVGDDGTILRSDDAGKTWNQVALPLGVVPSTDLLDVRIVESGEAVIVGENGLVLSSTNLGASWKASDVDGPSSTYDDIAYTSGEFLVSSAEGDFLVGDVVNNKFSLAASFEEGLTAISARDGEIFRARADGNLVWDPASPPQSGNPVIETKTVEAPALAPGGVWSTDISITNAGAGVVSISSIRMTGGVAEWFFAPRTLPDLGSGESASLTISYLPTNLGQHSANLEIVTSNPARTFSISLQGEAEERTWHLSQPPGGNTVVDIAWLSSTTCYVLESNAIYLTEKSGRSWAPRDFDPPGFARTLVVQSFNDLIVGGGNNQVNSVSGSYIARSVDSGKTWQYYATGSDNAVTDLYMLNSSVGYMVTDLWINTLRQRFPGDVYKTIDGGRSWALLTRPTTFFDGTAVSRNNAGDLFVLSNDRLYFSQNDGASWVVAIDSGNRDLEGIEFVGDVGWVYGEDGALYRTTTGGKPGAWTELTWVTDLDIEGLSALNANDVWIAASNADRLRVYRSQDGGVFTWSLEFDVANLGNQRWYTLAAAAPDRIAAGGFGNLFALRSTFTTEGQARGVLGVSTVVHAGAVQTGEPLTISVPVTNIGNDETQAADPFLTSSQGRGQWRVVSGLEHMNPEDVTDVVVELVATESGDHQVELVLPSSSGRYRRVEIFASAWEEPPLVTLDSTPSGVTIDIDGQPYTTPVTFTVSGDDDVLNPWAPGTNKTITAPDHVVLNGADLAFASWENQSERSFTIAAPTETTTLRARYVQTVVLPPALTMGAGGPCDPGANVTPPDGLSLGPWIRLSNANLSLPGIGSSAVSGETFLSANEISLTLEGTAFRFPANTDLPELLQVTDNSFRLSYTKGGPLTVVADSPGVEVLDRDVAPSLNATIRFAALNDFEVSLALVENFRPVPGILELGPGMIEFRNSPSLQFSLDGRLYLLRDGNGSWQVDQPYSLELEASSPFPIRLDNLPNPLLDVGLAQIGTTPSSAFSLDQEAGGALKLSVEDLTLEVLGRQVTSATAEVTTNGNASFTLSPGDNLDFGPFELAPVSDSFLRWNLRQFRLQLQLSSFWLRAPSLDEWPSGGLFLSGFTFDTGADFERVIPLPSFDLDGISLSATDPEADFLAFGRRSGVIFLSIRSDQNLLGNTLDLGFDINGAGSISGFLAGDFGVTLPVFGFVDFGSVDLSYDSDRTSYQFIGRLRAIENDFRLRFGSSGFDVCHLFCEDSDGPLSDCSIGLFCFP